MSLFTPGNEPEPIKKKLYDFFAKLDTFYPDKIVIGIHNEHKHLGEKLTALYRELGYKNGEEFLAAYGYRSEKKTKKVMTEDELKEREQALYETLHDRYPNGFSGKTFSELKSQNKDLSSWFSSTEKYLRGKNSSLCEQLIEQRILINRTAEATIMKGNIAVSKKNLNSELKKLKAEGFVYLSVDSFLKENGNLAEAYSEVLQDTNATEALLRNVKILVDTDAAQSVLEESFDALKNAIMGHYGFCRMFSSYKKAESDTSSYCPELIERIHRQCDMFGTSEEELKRLYEQYAITGQAAIDFEKSRMIPTELSTLVFDGKGKLMGCSLYEKGEHHDKPLKGTIDLIIPPGVTAIGSNIFRSWKQLRKVYIPDTVTNIGGYCFCGCTALRSMRLPKGLCELQRGVFSYSWSLKKIELPPALEKIKDNAFERSGLTAIDIPDSVSYIGMMSFIDCDKLTDIKVSASLASMLTVSEFKEIFDIEYKQEKRKKIKLTIDSELNDEKLSDDFSCNAFAANTTKKKRPKYVGVNLYQWFRDDGLLDKYNQILGNANSGQFIESMKKSIQETGYNEGEERFPRWLDNMTDIGYDFTYHNAFYRIRLLNPSLAAWQTLSYLEQKGAVIKDFYAECPEFKIKLEDVMDFIFHLRAVDKKSEIQVDCYIGGWASSFKGYSFVLNEGQYFPSYIYLNELKLV